MRISRLLSGASIAGLAALLASGAAMAQTPSASGATEASAADTGDIIVTARRRAERKSLLSIIAAVMLA